MSPTQLGCALVAGLAVAYGVEEWRRLLSGRMFRPVTRRQAIRRVVGAGLVACLMTLVYAGLELIEPRAEPGRFVAIWVSVCGLVVVVLGLALLDLRELRANRELQRTRDLIRLGREVGTSAREAAAGETTGSGSPDPTEQ